MKANYKTYHVTTDGRVYNKHGHQMRTQDNGRGYQIVGITSGRRVTKAVHRLVAEVYIPNPNCLSDVDHIDCDRTNNDLSNLRWVTHGDNIQHSYNTSNRTALGEVNANAKHTDGDVHNICYLLERGFTAPRIRDMGFGYNTVRSIKRGERWKHIASAYSI